MKSSTKVEIEDIPESETLDSEESVDDDLSAVGKISNPALRRILHRAGVKRVSKGIYEELRGCLDEFLDTLLEKIVIFVENDGRKTINQSDLDGVLFLRGEYVAAGLNPNAKKTKNLQSCNSRGKSGPVKKTRKTPVDGTALKPHRFKPGTRAIRSIKFQQKNSDCLAIPVAVFSKTSRAICSQYIEKPRFAVGVIELIQLKAENYIYKLCIDAYMCSKHANRDTVQAKDIQLVKSICSSHF